jgi:hypothetical protein
MTKYIATAKMYYLSIKREHMIYLCKSCKNLLAYGDGMVKSHLVRYGFIKDYTIWKFHGEAEDSSAGASGGGNSSTVMMAAVNAEQQTSLAMGGEHNNAATGDNANHDYLTMDDLLQDMANDDDRDGGETVRDPKTTELF